MANFITKARLFFSRYRKPLFFVSIFLATALSSFIVHKNNIGNDQIISADGGAVLAVQAEDLPIPTPNPDKKTLSVLLLGYGGPGHQGGFLTDVIMVAHFDFDKKVLGLISIPRDAWYQNVKVNQLLSVNQGGIDASRLKNTVSALTGLPIDYYIGIDFVGFQRFIGENLKGITVNVPETFEDHWYPIRGEEVNPCGKTPEEIAHLTQTLSGFALEKEFPCRYEHIYYPKGTAKMEGGDALKYVRSRHSSSDFSRSQRQKAVLMGIKDKLFSLNVFTSIDSFYQNVAKNVTSDLDLSSLKFVLPLLQNTNNLQPKNITLSTENVFTSSSNSSGAFILTPKESWQAVTGYIASQLTP